MMTRKNDSIDNFKLTKSQCDKGNGKNTMGKNTTSPNEDRYQKALNSVKSDVVKRYIKEIVLTNRNKNDEIIKPSNKDLKNARFCCGQDYEQLTTFLDATKLSITRGGASDSIEMEIMRKDFKVLEASWRSKGLIVEGTCRDALGNKVKPTLNLGKVKKSQDSTLKAS